jgi:hypothetical protein
VTVVIGAEKMSPEDALQHYGVKGMKWGHRRSASTADIKAARRRQDVRRADYQKAVARAAFTSVPFTKKHVRLATDARKKGAKFDRSIDRAISVRMTKGETALAAVLGPSGWGAIAVSQIASRALEADYNRRNPKRSRRQG